MEVLVAHCFAEYHGESYGLHSCVHDWTLQCLNQQVDPHQFFFSAACVLAQLRQDIKSEISTEEEPDHFCPRFEQLLVRPRFAPLAKYALRLAHEKFAGIAFTTSLRKIAELSAVGFLLTGQSYELPAIKILERTLSGIQVHEVSDENPELQVRVMCVLMDLHQQQGHLNMAETLCKTLISFFKNRYGPNHETTLLKEKDLGEIYTCQHKLVEAERILEKGLVTSQIAYGPENVIVYQFLRALGQLYAKMGETGPANILLMRAGAGLFGPSHLERLETSDGAGTLDEEPEPSSNDMLGPDTKISLDEYNKMKSRIISIIAYDVSSNRLDEGEKKLKQAFSEAQNLFGPAHYYTIGVLRCLTLVFVLQKNFCSATDTLRQGLESIECQPTNIDPEGLREWAYYCQDFSAHGIPNPARHMFERLQTIFYERLGPGHRNTMITKRILEDVEADWI